MPDNGNELREFGEGPRLHPSRSLVCDLFNRGRNRRALGLAGEGGGHLDCVVEPSPGRTRCRSIEVLSVTRPLSQ